MALATEVPAGVHAVCEAIARGGGRGVIVGGWVRDRLLDLPSKDIDIEVFGLSPDALEAVLGGYGAVLTVGRAFGVYKVKGIEADFSLPRRDSKVGPGHRGFEVAVDEALDFAEAARRRDFTINSIGLDPLTGELLDPHGGEADLAAGLLRATDPAHFAEDPLRGLRAAQFIARFELRADEALLDLCATLDLGELPGERLLEEFRKLLLKGVRPSRGLAFLHRSGLLGHFPELAALPGVPQDPAWHPEGDVWTHTLMVVDEATRLRAGRDDEALMFAALCHDLGKPLTTRIEHDGRVRSYAHESAGVAPTERLMGRLRAGHRLTAQVAVLVATHLAPAQLTEQGASAKAYRRLARRLEAAGADIELLVRVACADHLGRTTPDARQRVVPWREPFLTRAREALVAMRAPRPAVTGRHLIARGLPPGPRFRSLLDACQEIQDETGWTAPDEILDQALASASDRDTGDG